MQRTLMIARADRQTLAKQPADAWRLIESRNCASSVDELPGTASRSCCAQRENCEEAPVHSTTVQET